MKFRKIAALVLAMLMMASVLCACADTQPSGTSGKNPNGNNPNGNNPTTTAPTQPEKVAYQVAVYDANGRPATSGVIVYFMRDGEQVAMQTMNASGIAEKELEKGDYTVQLGFTNQEISYYYDTTDLTLSKTKTQLTIHLCLGQSEEYELVYANDQEYTAYNLYTGNTYVTLKPGRNYFLYKPTESGEYQLYTSDGYKTGYYGGTHYIMENDAGKEAPNNGTTMSLSASMISPDSSFVIGVDNPGEEDVNTILYAIRYSDYIDTSVRTVVYKATAALTPWTAPANARVNKFDITRAVPYKLVKDADGFYHVDTVTGPLVVVFLGTAAQDYMDYLVPYDVILKNSGVFAYFKNEDGTYDRRESYNDCLEDYIGTWDSATETYSGGCMDRKSGLYPLTDDLMYIIQNHGNHSGWWDVDDERYLFGDANVNKDNAWLFMCGYLN